MGKFKTVADLIENDITTGSANVDGAEKAVQKQAVRRKKGRETFSDGDLAMMAPIYRLSSLERAWPDVVGPTVAKRTAPVACEFADEGIKLTVHVEDPGLLHSIMFRKAQMTAGVKRFFKRSDVTLDIKPGKIPHRSTAKPPLPVFKRRAPVVISEERVEEETRRMFPDGASDLELTTAIARLKLTFEKLASRDRR